MRTSKKLLSLFLSAVLCLSLLPTMAWAQDKAVAKIGDTTYTKFEDAYAKAVENGASEQTKITLLENTTSVGLGTDGQLVNLELDLNDKTLTFTNPAVGSTGTKTQAFRFLAGSTVSIKNGTINVDEDNASADKPITMLINNYTDLTLDGVTLDGTNIDAAVYGAEKTPGDAYTLSNNSGTINIKDSKIIARRDDEGVEVAFDSCEFGSYDAPTVTVVNSTIDGKIEETGGKIVIESGSFTDLANAVKYAGDNAEIVLLKDASGGGLFINKTQNNLTLDLNGHTYTADSPVGSAGTVSQGLHIEAEKFTLKSTGTRGTFTSSGNDVKMLVQNYSDLALENVTLDGSNLPDTGRYVLSNNCGTTTIKDSTIEAKDGDVAFDVYGGFQSYGDVTVTVSGKSVINGKIEVARKSESQNENTNTLNIESGTINGDLAITEDDNTVVAITGGAFTDLADAVKYAADKATIELADEVELTETLEVNSGKTLTINLNEETLTGRVNVKHGNVTFTNGHIVGSQPLNAYGSSNESAKNYSVITITGSVVVNNENDDKNSMVIFGETAGTNGYGAVLNINGTVYGTVFVSGNLGNNDSYTDEMTASNIVNVKSGAKIYTAKDQGIAMNGAATVKVANGASVTGREAIGVKRGTLDIAGGDFKAVGEYENPNTVNNNGTDKSGAVIAVTDTYADFGEINVSIKGGTFVEETDASAIYVENGTYAVNPSISVTGGTFSSDPTAYVASEYAATKIAGNKYIVGKNVTVDGNQKVTGGTFDFDPRAYVASGYAVSNNVGGTYTVYLPSSGGGSSTTKTETTTNADGSKTTTTTDTKTGAVTETTTKTETAANGTKTETKVEVVTQKDGTVTEKQTETATAKNGTTATKVETTDAAGKTETKVEAKVTAAAVTEAKTADKPVTIPVTVESTKSAETAATVSVSVPKSAGSTKVEVPVTNVTAGTVAVLVKADGTEEIIKTSVLTEDGVALKVEGDVQIKIIDNTKEFTDVVDDHWAGDAIDFATSHEIFNGTGDNSFAPEATMTRGMLFTVLARFDDAPVVTTGENWYAGSMEWAKTNGVSDGTNPEASISREQLATMLYRYAGAPTVAGDLAAFGDAATVSDYAAAAMQWAVSVGLINGIGGNLEPQGFATRAQLAAIMQRFCTNVAF